METACTLKFGNGTYRFWLPLTACIAIERELSPLTLTGLHTSLEECIGVDEQGDLHYLSGAGVPVKAVKSILFHALVGGGEGLVDGEKVHVSDTDAQHLLETYFYPARPLEQGIAVAAHVLIAAIRGIDLKKNSADANATNSEESAKEPSLQTADNSDSTHTEPASPDTSKRLRPTTRSSPQSKAKKAT